MKSILLNMAIICLAITGLNSQNIITADISIRYPNTRVTDLDKIVFDQSGSTCNQPGHYTLAKQDWRKGDVFQVVIESSHEDIHAYFITMTEDGLLRHYAPSSGITGVTTTQIGRKIALPSVHNGFAFHKEPQLNGVLLLSKEPLQDINQELLQFDPAKGTLEQKIQAIWGDRLAAANDVEYGTTSMSISSKDSGIIPVYMNIFTANYQLEMQKSKLHVLCIGPSFSSLQYTTNDAQDVAKAFKNWEGRRYDEVNVELLTGEEATSAKIRQTLAMFKAKYLLNGANANDKVIVFCSTNGLMIDEEMFLQGSDFDQLRPRETAISYTEIYLGLKDFPGEKIVLLDAAAAPAVATYSPRVIGEEESIQPLATERFYPVFSNRSGEKSYENEAWENGAFTEALLEILYQQSANNQPVSMTAFLQYLTTRTSDLVSTTLQLQQHPVITRPQYIDFNW